MNEFKQFFATINNTFVLTVFNTYLKDVNAYCCWQNSILQQTEDLQVIGTSKPDTKLEEPLVFSNGGSNETGDNELSESQLAPVHKNPEGPCLVIDDNVLRWTGPPTATANKKVNMKVNINVATIVKLL